MSSVTISKLDEEKNLYRENFVIPFVPYNQLISFLNTIILLSLLLCPTTSFAKVPEFAGTWGSNSCQITQDSRTKAVAVVGKYAYIGGEGGFKILNISRSSNPSFVGGIDYPNNTIFALAVVGNYAYLACLGGGVKAIDITNPAAPVEVGHYVTGTLKGIAVVGNYVYVTHLGPFDSALLVVDVTDPSMPSLIGIGDTIYGTELGKIAIHGNYAYVTETKNCLYVYVYDITDPYNPFLTGQIDVNEMRPDGITTQGNYLFTANGDGLGIFNLANNQTHPTLAGRMITNKTASDVFIRGTCAYLVGQGMQLVNVKNVAAPTLTASTNCRAGENYNGVAVFEDYLYTGWNYNCSYTGEGSQQNGGLDVIKVTEVTPSVQRIDPIHLSIFTQQDPRIWRK